MDQEFKRVMLILIEAISRISESVEAIKHLLELYGLENIPVTSVNAYRKVL